VDHLRRLLPSRLDRLLFAGTARPNDPLASLLTLGIATCAVWSGLIHLGLGSTLFTLNGLGYLGNALLLLFTLALPRLRYRVRSYAAAWLALYAALTIAGYVSEGSPQSPAAIAALFAEGGIIIGAVALYAAYRRAYAQRVADRDEPVEHWVSAPSIAPFLLSALAGGLFFFVAANPWSGVACAPDPASDAQIAACDLLFDRSELIIAADTPVTLRFENRVAIPHNVAIHDGNAEAIGVERWRGELVAGPTLVDYTLPRLPAGTYAFICSIHPTMVGTLSVRVSQ
jgi:plastocyanin